MKPGWKTTEFWTTMFAQVLALLAFLGLLNPAERQTLEEALSKVVAAVFVLLANGAVVINYVRSRLAMKLGAASRPATPLLILLGLVIAGPVQAADTQATALLPWRAKIEQQLRGMQQRQGQPGPIIVQPPLQVLPIPGEPRQQLPIPGEPRQQLPIPGQPQQPLPIPGNPQQQVPIPGQPLQPLPYMPPASGPQSYTVFRALCRPME